MADAMLTPEIPAIISRSEAQAQGLKFYYTGTACAYGHVAKRYTSAGRCFTCHSMRRASKDNPPPDKVCCVDGCGGLKDTNGMCPKHYHMWKTYGDPLTKPQFDAGAGIRWLEAHKSYQGEECLIWPFGSCGTSQFKHIPGARGYGQSNIKRKKLGAHVHMAILAYGDRRSEGLIVAHTCGKGHDGCCNPRHLRWSTHKENTADRYDHGTVPLGSENPNAKLTEDDVRFIRMMKGVLTKRQLAEKFSVNRSVIQKVQSRETWRHVE